MSGYANTVNLNWMDRSIVFRNMWVQLIICIIVDAISLASSIADFTGAGIATNLVVAPMQTFVIYTMVGMERQGKPLMAMAFLEELAPVFWLPSCLIAWVYKVWWT